MIVLLFRQGFSISFKKFQHCYVGSQFLETISDLIALN